MATEPVDLVRVVEEALGLLDRTVPAHIDLKADLAPQPCTIQADATRIHQVLMNLALNARDAMPRGGELRIAASEYVLGGDEPAPVPEMTPGRWCALAVSDTGTGLSEEAQAHLFEPFFTTKEERGTGLGLAQVYGIVNQHGGFIDVETAPGKGTTFTIFFPCGEEADHQSEAVPASDPAAGPGRSAGGGTDAGAAQTILVVEDGDQLREAIRVGFEPLEYEVITASDGEQALEAVSQHDVDLVVTDLVMPRMGGEELLSRLRTVDADLRVIAMTGHVVDRDIDSLREAGFSAALPKPFSFDDLLALVTETLESAGR
jgi:CheY-like chemotaxis protein